MQAHVPIGLKLLYPVVSGSQTMSANTSGSAADTAAAHRRARPKYLAAMVFLSSLTWVVSDNCDALAKTDHWATDLGAINS